MKIVSVVGNKGSGKTTTVEAVVRELTMRGYLVDTIKDIHMEGFTIEKEGTNTWKHRMAGANVVVARGLEETDFLFPRQLEMDEILGYLEADYVVIEGWRSAKIPSILCLLEEEEPGSIIEDRKPICISGRITRTERLFGKIPVLDALRYASELADLIEREAEEWP